MLLIRRGGVPSGAAAFIITGIERYIFHHVRILFSLFGFDLLSIRVSQGFQKCENQKSEGFREWKMTNI